jgi:hypothetical protein
MLVQEMTTVHDFVKVGEQRNPYTPELTRDFIVRYIVGRNGEAISILEEFDPNTGTLVNVFWQVDYDPSDRIKMIYG